MRASSASIVTAIERVLCLRPTMYEVMNYSPGLQSTGNLAAPYYHIWHWRIADAMRRARIAANIAKLPELLRSTVYSRYVSKLDEYRAKAEYCREMAAKSIGPADKEEWLQQAAKWRTLASLSDRAAEMNDPHEKQMEVLDEIWETLASRLSKENGKA